MLQCKNFIMKNTWLLFLGLAVPALSLRTVEPPPPPMMSRNSPTEGWVNVRVNHFMAHNNDTFPMRYYYNDVSPGDNVVIFVGGEWAISPGWTSAGLAYQLAEVVGGGIFYTEHRYYGLSTPTEDTSTPDLRHLTVDQALGDLAQFIEYVKSDAFEYGRFKNGSVGLVGCSYAGSMATWMRLAYPHLVDVAFSDSGPLHAQEDFPEYLEVVTEAIRTQGGQECVDVIQDAMERITDLLNNTQNGPAQISQMFHTCSVIQTNPLDLATFFWYGITESFAYLVQYATPGDIPAVCQDLVNGTSPDPVQRLANFVTSQSWTQPCLETRYTEVVAAHTNTSYEAPQSVMRLWTYQTCVEFGWYQTTNSDRQPFLDAVPLEYFHHMCRDFFGSYFTESLLQSGVSRTNLLFGGLSMLPDHVVSVVGGADPWSAAAPAQRHATPLAPVHVVPDISHCRAIRQTGISETEELETAKVEVLQYMSTVMGRPLIARDAARVTASLVLLLAVVLTALL